MHSEHRGAKSIYSDDQAYDSTSESDATENFHLKNTDIDSDDSDDALIISKCEDCDQSVSSTPAEVVAGSSGESDYEGVLVANWCQRPL